MRLSFNAPVPVKLLQGIRLVSAKETLKPTLGGDGEGGQDDDNVLSSVTFPGLFAEQTAFTLELPKGFRDATRACPLAASRAVTCCASASR